MGSYQGILITVQSEVGLNVISILKYQVAKIDSLTKNMGSSLWASLERLQYLTYDFSKFLRIIEVLGNL